MRAAVATACRTLSRYVSRAFVHMRKIIRIEQNTCKKGTRIIQRRKSDVGPRNIDFQESGHGFPWRGNVGAPRGSILELSQLQNNKKTETLRRK